MAPTPTAIEPLLSDAEVSAIIGVAIQTLRIWRLQGKGPRFQKMGKLVRYRRDHVMEYIEQHTVRSTAEAAILTA